MQREDLALYLAIAVVIAVALTPFAVGWASELRRYLKRKGRRNEQ